MNGIYLTEEALQNFKKEIIVIDDFLNKQVEDLDSNDLLITSDKNNFTYGIKFMLEFIMKNAKIIPESEKDWEDILFDIIDENEDKYKDDGGFQIPIEIEEYFQDKFPNGLVINPK